MSIWFRPPRGLLKDSMAAKVAVKNKADLIAHLKKNRVNFPGDEERYNNIMVKPYPGPGMDINTPQFDERIGWHTWLVVDGDGHAIGYTNGPLDNDGEESR